MVEEIHTEHLIRKLYGKSNDRAIQENYGRTENDLAQSRGIEEDGTLELSFKWCVGGSQVKRVAGEGTVPGKQILKTHYSIILLFIEYCQGVMKERTPTGTSL